MRTIIGLAMLAVVASTGSALAVSDTPVGLWRTFNDDGRETGRVEIFDRGGVLYGRIAGIVDPVKARGTCEKCTDDRKGQPAMGLQIIRGMHADGDRWDGGEILDPETGSTYSCTMRLGDGGRTLLLRGFIGVSLFGRSQTWQRAP